MKILCLIDNLGSGGAQRQLANLARGLKGKGHEVEFFIYYPDSHYRPLLEEASIPIHLHPKPSRFSLAPLVALRRLLTGQRFDVVVSYLATPNLYAELAGLGLRGTKIVVSERSTYPWGSFPLALRVQQEGHRLADAITVNSHHQRERMIGAFKWMAPVSRTIYNGIDLETFRPAPRYEGPFALVAVGTIVKNKNMLGLAQGLAICRDRYGLKPQVRWLGKRSNTPAGERAFSETVEYLTEQGLGDQWEWLGERQDVPQLLPQHTALIHPSFYEGLPNVVCEALSCGLPVLASKVCDHPHLVQEGERGGLFDPKEPEDIARAIQKLMSCSADGLAAMGAKARDFAERELSMEKYTDSYERLFLELTTGRGHA